MKYIIYNVRFGDDTIVAIKRDSGNPVYVGFHYGASADGQPSAVIVGIIEKAVVAMAKLNGDSQPEVEVVRVETLDEAFLQPLDAAVMDDKPARFSYADRQTGQTVVVEKEYATEAFMELLAAFPECLDEGDFFSRSGQSIVVGEPSSVA